MGSSKGSHLQGQARWLGAEVPTLRLDVEGMRVDLSFGNSAGRAKSALVAGFLAENRNLRNASALLSGPSPCIFVRVCPFLPARCAPFLGCFRPDLKEPLVTFPGTLVV